MKSLKEIEVTYMGSSFTIKDFFDFVKDINLIKDLKKVAGLTYLSANFDNVKRRTDSYSYDEFICSDMLYNEYKLPLILCYLKKYKINILDYDLFYDLIHSQNEDETHLYAVKFAEIFNH